MPPGSATARPTNAAHGRPQAARTPGGVRRSRQPAAHGEAQSVSAPARPVQVGRAAAGAPTARRRRQPSGHGTDRHLPWAEAAPGRGRCPTGVEHADSLTRLNRAKGMAHIMITHSLADLDTLVTEEDRAKARGFMDRSAITVLAGLPPRELARVNEITPLTGPERALVGSCSAPEPYQTAPATPAAASTSSRPVNGSASRSSSPSSDPKPSLRHRPGDPCSPASSYYGRQGGSMSDQSDAEQWHEMARHLVQAHGAEPGGLMVYAPTLEQLRFAHADTHVALASINELPPDRHTHPLPMDAGWYDRGSRPTVRSRRQLLPATISSASRTPIRPACLTPTFSPSTRATWPSGRPCGHSTTHQRT